MTRLSLLLAFTLLSPLAHAAPKDEVLFLDFNASIKEKKAARKAALASGRGFRAYPDTSDEEGEEIFRLRNERTALENKLEGPCDDNPSPACDKMKVRVKAVRERLDKLNEKFKVKEDDFKKVLAEQASDGNTISSLVISGHDGTGEFSGDFGQMEDIDIAAAIGAHPGLKEGIRSLHLWGCNTTTPGSLLTNWNKNFPNAMFIAGYDDSAPLNTRAAGWKYLAAVMKDEPKFQAIADAKKLKAALRAIPGVTGMHAAIYNCGYWASVKDSIDLNDYKDRCDGLKKEILAQENTWNCFLKAEAEACRAIPADKANGPVRAFYRTLQKAEACREIIRDPIFRQYSRDQVIRLNFFDEIARNIARIYADELKQSDDFLDRLGAPKALRMAGIDKMSRGELRELIEGLNKFLRDKLPNPNFDPSGYQPDDSMAMVLAVESIKNRLLRQAFTIDPYCIPFSWTEPGKTQETDCFKKADFGNAKLGAILAEKGELKGNVLRSLRDIVSDRKAEERAKPSTEPAVHAARQTVMLAQIRRLEHHIYGANPERLAISEARLAWAEEVKRLAEGGEKEAETDPRAKLLHYRAAKLTAQEDAAYAQKQLEEARTVNPGTNYPAYERIVNRERLKAALLEKLERTQDPSVNSEEKARLAEEIKAGQYSHGEIRFQQEVDDYESEVARAQKKLSAGPSESWAQELRRAEEALAKFRAEKEEYITRNIKREFEARAFEDYE